MDRHHPNYFNGTGAACQTDTGALPDASAATARGPIRALLAAFVLAGAVMPAGAADVIKGAQIYARHCAACHGPNGVSVMPGAPQLARTEGLMQSDLALLASLKTGKNAMPAYIGILSDRDILDVIAYSRTLRK